MFVITKFDWDCEALIVDIVKKSNYLKSDKNITRGAF